MYLSCLYCIQDVIELRQIEVPHPSQPKHHRSCLKLIIPFHDYGVVSLLLVKIANFILYFHPFPNNLTITRTI